MILPTCWQVVAWLETRQIRDQLTAQWGRLTEKRYWAAWFAIDAQSETLKGLPE